MSKSPSEIKASLKALKNTYTETAREEFNAGFKELFDRYPRLISIGFTAYTPYFSDGNENVYRVNNDEPTINGFDYYDDGDETNDNLANLWEESKKDGENYNPESRKCIDEVIKLLGAFGDDVYQDIVGDHVEVEITRKGIKTSDYQHG